MSERKFNFVTCDVFTEQRFGGNPLAMAAAKAAAVVT